MLLMSLNFFVFIIAMAGASASATSVATKNEVVTTIRELESLHGKSTVSASCMFSLPTGHRGAKHKLSTLFLRFSN